MQQINYGAAFNAPTQVARRFLVREVPKAERTPRVVRRMTKTADAKGPKDTDRYSMGEPIEVPQDQRVFDVIMPSGQTVRLTETEMVRHGFDKPADLVMMGTGDIIPVQDWLEGGPIGTVQAGGSTTMTKGAK